MLALLSRSFSSGSFHEFNLNSVMKQTLQGSEACEYVDKDVDSQEQVLPLVQTPGGEW